MTRRQNSAGKRRIQDWIKEDGELMPEVMREAIQEVLEAEMTEALGSAKHERAEERLGYRSGSYRRMLISGVGKLELRVPQERLGRFSTEVFDAISGVRRC